MLLLWEKYEYVMHIVCGAVTGILWSGGHFALIYALLLLEIAAIKLGEKAVRDAILELSYLGYNVSWNMSFGCWECRDTRGVLTKITNKTLAECLHRAKERDVQIGVISSN